MGNRNTEQQLYYVPDPHSTLSPLLLLTLPTSRRDSAMEVEQEHVAKEVRVGPLGKVLIIIIIDIVALQLVSPGKEPDTELLAQSPQPLVELEDGEEVEVVNTRPQLAGPEHDGRVRPHLTDSLDKLPNAAAEPG